MNYDVAEKVAYDAQSSAHYEQAYELWKDLILTAREVDVE